MNNSLIDFHLDCQEEFYEILKEFNILFYGYGDKEELLRKLFPKSAIVNCAFMDLKEIISQVRASVTKLFIPRIDKSRIERSKDSVFFIKANKIMKELKKDIIVILLNFNMNLDLLNNHSNIKLICTLESLEINFTSNDIEKYNFVLRDLTTFKPYKKEILNIQFKDEKDQVETALSVIDNVSKKSREIFLRILNEFKGSKTIKPDDLIQKVGKKFLLRKISDLIALLGEFFDHKLLKKERKDEIGILLSRKDIEQILKERFKN